jgi:hypothetical protein
MDNKQAARTKYLDRKAKNETAKMLISTADLSPAEQQVFILLVAAHAFTITYLAHGKTLTEQAISIAQRALGVLLTDIMKGQEGQ